MAGDNRHDDGQNCCWKTLEESGGPQEPEAVVSGDGGEEGGEERDDRADHQSRLDTGSVG